MTPKSIVTSVLLSATFVLSFSGCTAPLPPVTTFWDKMGVSFAFATIRDNRLNKDGNRPWKEWKPPKLRLADPRNLLSDVPAIKAAAEIKMDEDLADQKIKALKYMGLIGCGCYDKDKKMQAAFLDALNDCTPCVRLAAIEALQLSADQCNLQAQTFKALREDCDKSRRTLRAANKATRERPLCKNCGNQGCASCGYGEYVTYDTYGGYSDCGYCGGGGCGYCGGSGYLSSGGGSGCMSCGGGGCVSCGGGGAGGSACASCLGKEICKRLDEMAHKQDDDGCWIEPVPQIREAAAQLHAWCPPPEPPPVKPPQTEIEGGEEIEGSGDAETINDTIRFVPTANGFITSNSRWRDPAYGQGYDASRFQTPWDYQQSTNGFNPQANNQQPMNVSQNPPEPNALPPVVKPANIMAVPTTPAVPTSPASSVRPPSQAASSTIIGKIVAARDSEVAIQFEQAYRLPDGAKLLVAASNGTEVEMTVIASDAGVVMAETTNPGISVDGLQGAQVEIGILAK